MWPLITHHDLPFTIHYLLACPFTIHNYTQKQPVPLSHVESM